MTLDSKTLRSVGLGAGLAAVGVTTAEPFGEVRVELERRRGQGLHAGMQFTYRNPARSTDPSRTLGSSRRLVVGAWSFRRGPTAPARRPAARPAATAASGLAARVAAYAAEDHYAGLRSALEAIADRIRSEGFAAVVLADENNLVDRATAHRAGLGWWGKSSNILVPGHGSMVVLGSVLTDASIALPEGREPVAESCGACSACISACPTAAIVAPGVVDANRCLAWLLQASGPFPVEYREALGDRIYGCDDCQDACPPNRVRTAGESRGEPEPLGPAAAGSAEEQPLAAGKEAGSGPLPETWHTDGSFVDVIAMLDADDEALMERFGRWYIAERDPAYLRRNALVVLANIARGDDPEARRVLADALAHPSGLVRSHALWAARRLGLGHLAAALADDTDPGVQRELARRVAPAGEPVPA